MLTRRNLIIRVVTLLAILASTFAYATTPTKLSFSGARFRFPTMTAQATTARHSLAVISELAFYTPNYITRDHLFLFPNYWTLATNHEVPNANSVAVEFSFSLDGRVTWIQGKFAHNSMIVIPAGGQIWSDRGVDSAVNTPANTLVWVRTLYWVNDGEYRVEGMIPTGLAGLVEAAQRDADYTNLIPLLSGGSITNNVGGADLPMFGPAMVVGRSDATVRSILVVGDSVAAGFGQSVPNSRNIVGMYSMGLDAAGFGVNDMAYNAASLAAEGTTAFVQRAAALNSLYQLPFDTILSDLGAEDVQRGASPTDMQGLLNTWIARMRLLFPGVRIVQGTILPKTTGSCVTQAGQTVPSYNSFPTGSLFQYAAYVKTNAGGLLDGYLDMTPTFSAQYNPNSWDAVDKWRTDNDTVPYTNDCTHPDDLGHATGALVIEAAAMGGGI